MSRRNHQAELGPLFSGCSLATPIKQMASEPAAPTISSRSITAPERWSNPSLATATVAAIACCSSDYFKSIKMSRVIRWQSSYCYFCATTLLVFLLLVLTNANRGIQCKELDGGGDGGRWRQATKTSHSSQSRGEPTDSIDTTPAEANTVEKSSAAVQLASASVQRRRLRRSPLAAAPSVPASLLMPINELRVSGSKSEPPSRPSVDWSKQRPYFGPDMVRNVSVELGKTAYLTCKVFELGDKTVSWLRPRENEILTAGRYTYIGDSRFASINDNGSHDWILEIKDVGLNDSTSYECQVSTDPKMSVIINLQVKAAKAKIKQGEQFYAPMGTSIEFTCEIGQRAPAYSALILSPYNGGVQQTYWYYNGNLLNYARPHNSLDKNFSIEWDSMTQTSRFRLFNIQLNDAGNYTCKPTSAEPATIRLHVKRFNKSVLKDRTHYGGSGYHSANTKEAQRTRQQFNLETDAMSDSSAPKTPTSWLLIIIACCSYITVLINSYNKLLVE